MSDADASITLYVEISEEVTVDVLVVGSGASGFPASITAAQKGATVMMIEQLSFLGGGSIGAKGFGAFDSSIQKEKGIDITANEVFTKVMDYSHWV